VGRDDNEKNLARNLPISQPPGTASSQLQAGHAALKNQRKIAESPPEFIGDDVRRLTFPS
jgi:hypothetical protein